MLVRNARVRFAGERPISDEDLSPTRISDPPTASPPKTLTSLRRRGTWGRFRRLAIWCAWCSICLRDVIVCLRFLLATLVMMFIDLAFSTHDGDGLHRIRCSAPAQCLTQKFHCFAPHSGYGWRRVPCHLSSPVFPNINITESPSPGKHFTATRQLWRIRKSLHDDTMAGRQTSISRTGRDRPVRRTWTDLGPR